MQVCGAVAFLIIKSCIRFHNRLTLVSRKRTSWMADSKAVSSSASISSRSSIQPSMLSLEPVSPSCCSMPDWDHNSSCSMSPASLCNSQVASSATASFFLSGTSNWHIILLTTRLRICAKQHTLLAEPGKSSSWIASSSTILSLLEALSHVTARTYAISRWVFHFFVLSCSYLVRYPKIIEDFYKSCC